MCFLPCLCLHRACTTSQGQIPVAQKRVCYYRGPLDDDHLRKALSKKVTLSPQTSVLEAEPSEASLQGFLG